MITYKKYYDAKNLNKDEVILDIETTGLDAARDNLVLLGMIRFIDDKAYILQYFAEDNSEETRLLEIYKKNIEGMKIINFNGDKFDIPFLNVRLDALGLEPVFPESLDIYKVISANRKYFSFDSMKLSELEKLIGITRSDPSRYKVISKLTDDILRRENPWPIMVHNENDLIATERLAKAEDFFREKLTIDVGDFSIYLKSIWINNDICQIILKSSKDLSEAYFTADNYELRVISDELTINIQVLYGQFDSKIRGHVSLNVFGIKNQSDLVIDPNLLIIREDRLYNYKNILALSKKIIENHL